MNLSEFRKNLDLVEQARAWLKEPIGVMMLQMLKDEHAHNYHLPFRNAEQSTQELGRIYGYDNCMANIEMATIPWTQPAGGPLEADWGVSEQEET